MMHLIVPCPDPELLSPYPKNNPTKAPQRDQAHVRHDRLHVSILDNPRVDEFRESVAPNVLIDRNAHEY